LKRIIFIVCAICFAIGSYAQSGWGKADTAQFSQRICAFDSSTNAVVLADSAYVLIERTSLPAATANGFHTVLQYEITSTVYTIYKRIQILDKEGVSASNITIPLITFMNMQRLTQLKAQTLNITDKGKIQITKVKDESFYYDTLVRGAFSSVKFTFPDVKVGSIIEYSYTLTVIGTVLKDWLFQTELPTVRSAISLKLPDYAPFNIRFEGNLPLIKDPAVHYNDAWNSVEGEKYHFAMNNIPATKPEPFLTSINDYVNRLRFYPERVSKFNGVTTHKTYRNWDEVFLHGIKTEKFMALQKNVAWGFFAKAVVAGITDKAEKVKAIYNQLHSVMKWNKLYSIAPTASITSGGSDSSGNSADINLTLVGMLRAAGIKADPVLISTRDHGKIDTSFYNPRQFNSIIAVAELDSTEVLLDADNAFTPWAELPENDLNTWGLRIMNYTSDTGNIFKTAWVNVVPTANSTTGMVSVIAVDTSGSETAKCVFTATDYCAMPFRNCLEGKSEGDCAKDALKIPDNMNLSDEKFENGADIDKRLKISITLEKKNVSESDSFIYINIFPVKFYSDNPLSQKQRSYPIDFAWPVRRNLTSSVTFPDNYKVAEIPKSLNFMLKDSSAGFSLLVAQTEMNIQVKESFIIGKTHYSTEMFEDLKALYAKMIDACNSFIVLQKK
jgi:hypothetical protein